ncbi:MAG: type II secretion system major pseudopilin GspG [Cryobacterium sp.]|nr:type II secretion system major pseudopilin GspG [Oligoflexia bacterium]
MKNNSSNLLKTTLRNERGFTLTEMLIVVAIIAMIGTFAVSKITAQYGKAKVDATKIQIRNLATTLDNYRLDCNFYPTTDQGIEALVTKATVGRDCKNYNSEGYAKKVPVDSWGQPFLYESDGQKFLIKSYAADAAEGGEGNNADITSDSI